MLFRGLDSSHDWLFGGGLSSYASGEAAVGLNIQTRLLSFLGNAPWDMTAGLNWFIFLGTPGTLNQALLSIKAVILQSYGVTKVNSVTYNVTANGTANIQYDISTIYSPSYKQSLQVNSPAGQG